MSTVALGLARGGIEVKQFFRSREQAVFTFAFPLLILTLLGSIFNRAYEGTGVTAAQVFTASMVGAGIISTSFVNLSISVASDRENGTLMRLRGTPLSAVSYFMGKVVLVAVASLGQAILVVGIGALLYDVHLPTSLDKWLTFVWVFVLAVVSCSMLGIATSAVARSGQGAAAVANVPYIGLQFISGVYVGPITTLPVGMVTVASFFPIKWVCQGFRSVFLPDAMAKWEMAGTWELGRTAVVLGAWSVAGLVLCLLTFRWTSNRT